MKQKKVLLNLFPIAKLQALFSFLVNYFKSTTTQNFRRRRKEPWKTYVIVPIIAVIVFSFIKIMLESMVQQQRPLVYTGAVIFSAWYGGIWAGVFATFLSSFFIDFFFLKPYYSLFQRSIVQSLELIMFFGFGLSVSILIEAMYSAARGERESARLINHILESITDGFINFDKQFRIAYINPTAAKIVKKKSPEFMNFIQYYGRQAMQSHTHREEEFFYTRTQCWYDVDFYPAVNGLTVYLSDITGRKQNEEKLIKMERRKDEFISIASHELKTPLTSIKAFTQLLQRHSQKINDKTAINYLGRMDGQLSRLNKLVFDLLDVAKIEEGKLLMKKESFDFDRLVDEITEEMRIINPQHEIIRQGTSKIKLLADKFRISQVMVILIDNALKYSGHNRKIIVKTTAQNNNALMTVQDFGIGIAKIHHPEIFKKFYRVDSIRNRSYPGLGLGLYISSEIIKRHHGKIWVSSAEGKGSIFTISLPRHQ